MTYNETGEADSSPLPQEYKPKVPVRNMTGEADSSPLPGQKYSMPKTQESLSILGAGKPHKIRSND